LLPEAENEIVSDNANLDPSEVPNAA